MIAARLLRCAVTVLLAVALSVVVHADENVKFRGTTSPIAGLALYRVSLASAPPDTDDATLSEQIAMDHRIGIEPYAEEGFRGFLIRATEARARLVSEDSRVALVEHFGAPHRMADLPAPAVKTPAVEVARPRSIETTTTAIAGFGTFSYDGAGNITSIAAGSSEDTFVYDVHGRVTVATLRSGHSQNYSYDRHGNITRIATGGDSVPVILGVNASTNRIDSATGLSGQAANVVTTYDDSGNMTTYNSDQFVYDGMNRVKEATVGGVRFQYIYNTAGERLGKIELTSTGNERRSDWTIRDPQGRILRRFSKEPSGQWQWNQDYIYANGRLLAADVPAPIKRLHYHLDHLGSPRLITGNGGAEISRHTYYPFGVEVPPATADGELLKFTGHERDAASLDYMHARYYGPFVGRFLSVDPGGWDKARPQTWNRYTYAENNPVLKVDPDGRQAVIPMPAAGPMAPLGVAFYHAQQMQTNPSYRRAAVDGVTAIANRMKADAVLSVALAKMLWDTNPLGISLSSRVKQLTERDKRGPLGDAVDNLDSIQDRQRRIRQGRGSGIIDSTGKSEQKVDHLLDRIKSLDDALDDEADEEESENEDLDPEPTPGDEPRRHRENGR
jgi:RHS repeat-associated protein